MKHRAFFKLENFSWLFKSLHIFSEIILGLERCIEIMWEKLMLFTLYNVFTNLFLKLDHVYRMWTLTAFLVSLEEMGIAGVSCFYHPLLYSVVSPWGLGTVRVILVALLEEDVTEPLCSRYLLDTYKILPILKERYDLSFRAFWLGTVWLWNMANMSAVFSVSSSWFLRA